MPRTPQKQTQKQAIGEIGESLACRFLEGKGYKIIGRNYLKPYGEIDIIAQNRKETVFIEVKSVTRQFLAHYRLDGSESAAENVSYETGSYRPEENLHPWKLKRLTRAINSYLVENRIAEGEWRFDVVIVYLNTESKQAKIEHLEGIIL